MRYIERGATPKKLADEAEVQKWTEQYLGRRREWEARGKKGTAPRPRHDIYADEEVCERLVAISGGGKCFYCESKLTIDYDENGKILLKVYEVDHYIELAEKPELAYDWNNLYLSCTHCNDKYPNTDIPNNLTLDPCSDMYPHAQHLTFDKEVIVGLTERGSKTIEKYKLWKLETRRAKQLSVLNEILLEIRELQAKQGRTAFNDTDKAALRKFMAKEYPFSLMFSVYLAKYNL